MKTITRHERLPPSRPAALTVTALAEDGAAVWTAMMREGFGLSETRVDHFRRAVGDEDIRVTRQDGRIVGTAALLPMAQWFGGRPVPVAGIAAVTVAGGERRRGVGAAVLRALLAEARDRGSALAILHAATLPLYRRLGFARAGVAIDYRLSVARTLAPLADPARRASLRLSQPLAVDPAILTAIRQRQAPRSNGMVERPPLLWANLLSPCDQPAPNAHLFHGADGAVEGYLLLPPSTGGSGILAIADLCLLTGDAVEQALSFLAGWPEPVTEMRWAGGSDDPMAFLAPEVEVDIDDWDLWLARVLDVPRALSTRGYPNALNTQLDFVICDPLFPANNGRWRLTVCTGRGAIEPQDTESATVPTLRLPVTTLTPLLTSHMSAPSLWALGLLEGACDAVTLATALFTGPPPVLADRF